MQQVTLNKEIVVELVEAAENLAQLVAGTIPLKEDASLQARIIKASDNIRRAKTRFLKGEP